jgi:hypothetical protein
VRSRVSTLAEATLIDTGHKKELEDLQENLRELREIRGILKQR